jgi:hypothetical protein
MLGKWILSRCDNKKIICLFVCCQLDIKSYVKYKKCLFVSRSEHEGPFNRTRKHIEDTLFCQKLSQIELIWGQLKVFVVEEESSWISNLILFHKHYSLPSDWKSKEKKSHLKTMKKRAVVRILFIWYILYSLLETH